jgi:hypothetical protein
VQSSPMARHSCTAKLLPTQARMLGHQAYEAQAQAVPRKIAAVAAQLAQLLPQMRRRWAQQDYQRVGLHTNRHRTPRHITTTRPLGAASGASLRAGLCRVAGRRQSARAQGGSTSLTCQPIALSTRGQPLSRLFQ